jgi:hypothetical protein
MTTFSEPKSDHPINKPPRDPKEESRRRAECAERISRLLSALDGGPASDKTQHLPKQAISGKTEHLPKQAISGKTEHLPKQAISGKTEHLPAQAISGKTEHLPAQAIGETKTNPQSDTAQRFLLVDRNGPIGEFDSWEDANRYKNQLHHSGAAIISVAKNPLKPGAGREQPTQHQPTQHQPTEQPTEQPASTAGLNSPTPSTTQELQKADKTGDSNLNSVGEDCAPPAKPARIRIVGRIFPAAARTVTLNACPKLPVNRYELLVLGNAVAQNTNEDRFSNLTLNCAPQDPRHETINIHYTTE